MPTTRKLTDASIPDATTIAGGDRLLGLQGGVVKRFARSLLDAAYAVISHKAQHEDGGTDEISVQGLSGVAGDAQKVQVLSAGASVGTRPTINLIAGLGATLTVADNAGANRVDVTISGPGGSDALACGLRDIAQQALNIDPKNWGLVEWDYGGYYTTADAGVRMTIPAGAGGVHVAVAYPPLTAGFTGYVESYLRHRLAAGTVASYGRYALNIYQEGQTVAAAFNLTAADYIEEGLSRGGAAAVTVGGPGGYLRAVRLASQSGCQGQRIASLSLSGTTEQTVAFNGVDPWDTDAYHDPVTNNTKFFAPVTGNYLVIGQCEYTLGSPGSILRLRANGSAIFGEYCTSYAVDKSAAQVFGLVHLNAGEYVEMTVRASASDTIGTINLWMVRVGGMTVASTTATQSMPNNAEMHHVLDTGADYGGGLTLATPYLTVPVDGAGLYVVVGMADYPVAAAGTSIRTVSLNHNAFHLGRMIARAGGSGWAATQGVNAIAIARATPGQKFSIASYQNSGAAITTGTRSYLAVAKLTS